jgi:uracil permease
MDHKNLSNILDKDLLKDPGLDKTLTGDGVATAISGCLSGVANTTYLTMRPYAAMHIE